MTSGLRKSSLNYNGLLRALPLVLLGVVFAWSYAPTLVELWQFWQVNEDYSAGMLVPMVAAYLIWKRRTEVQKSPASPCWWGLTGVVVAQVVRFGGAYYDYGSLERLSVYLTVVSLILLTTGVSGLWRLRWILVFLALALPPPGRIHRAVVVPLQDVATTSTVFLLELAGQWVSREGNVLRVNDSAPVAVAEACSGLRMLAAFVIVGATFALLVQRPVWQRLVLVASSIPVAIGVNAIRLVCTVVFFNAIGGDGIQRAFHDFAGVAMMPIAVLLMFGELRLLNWLAQSGVNAVDRPASKIPSRRRFAERSHSAMGPIASPSRQGIR